MLTDCTLFETWRDYAGYAAFLREKYGISSAVDFDDDDDEKDAIAE